MKKTSNFRKRSTIFQKTLKTLKGVSFRRICGKNGHFPHTFKKEIHPLNSQILEICKFWKTGSNFWKRHLSSDHKEVQLVAFHQYFLRFHLKMLLVLRGIYPIFATNGVFKNIIEESRSFVWCNIVQNKIYTHMWSYKDFR